MVVTELAQKCGRVTRIDTDGNLETIVATGRPNGLALDRKESLWLAESLVPSLLEITTERRVVVRARECEGEPFLWPNDICIGPDGCRYLTDSGALVSDYMQGDAPAPGWASVSLDGKLFMFPASGDGGTILDRGLQFANGIAFGPDDHLYLSETVTGNIYRYRPGAWKREEFANVLDPAWTGTGFRGPDGMAFDEGGFLWVAVFGQGDVTVISPDGEVVERYPLIGRSPTNCAFGPRGSRTLYVVEDELGNVEALPVPRDGLALHT
jgi:gluconolactonase